LNCEKSLIDIDGQSILNCDFYEHARGGFVEHLSLTLLAQQSVTKYIAMTAINLVTPKAATKPELLFNKPAIGKVTGILVLIVYDLKGQGCKAIFARNLRMLLIG